MTAKRQRRRYREARRLGVVRDRAEFDELVSAGERPLRLATVDTTNSVYAAMVEARDAGDNEIAASLRLRWLDLCKVTAGSLASSMGQAARVVTIGGVREVVIIPAVDVEIGEVVLA